MYPSHLGRGSEPPRVPLHRRGKSNTYERMEDLLREAGYKETRVFTPEAERLQAQAQTEQERKERKPSDGHQKGGRATALAGFLAGFVPWNDSTGQRERVNSQDETQESDNGKLRSKDGDYTDPWHPPTPTPNRRPFVPAIETSDASSAASSSTLSSRSPPFLQDRNPRPSARLGTPSSRDARTTLRHMISTPDIPKRPQMSKTRRVTDDPTGKLKRSRADEAGTPLPPMPANWLSTVARAVIGAGTESGVHVGGPLSGDYARSRRPVPRSLRDNTYNGKERRATSLARRGFTPHTPRGRVSPAPSVVTPASVVCKSAPGSRSTSLVRSRSAIVKGGLSRRNSNLPRVPSLGITSVELEGLPVGLDVAMGVGMTPQIRLDSETDDDSDEGEPDFARLIVPARRQHSIQSLRKHLHANACPGSSIGPRLYPTISQPGSTQGSVRRVLRKDSKLFGGAGAEHEDALGARDTLEDSLAHDVRRSRRGSMDEGEDGLAFWAAHGLPGLETAVGKKRAALPWPTWNQGK